MAFSGLVQLLHQKPASGDLSADQYKIVQIDASDELALAGAGAGGFVLQDKPDAAGKSGTILLGGKGKVKVGAVAVDGGALITSDANGLAITAATTDVVVGIMLHDAAAGDLGTFLAVQSTLP